MNKRPHSPGIHGELASYGDYITRRLPRELVHDWDNGLQRAIATSTSIGAPA
jgi:hypothetical protein